jgi:hypothetical protein
MAYNTWDLGDKVRVSAPFTLVSSGGAVDPDVVKLSVQPPSGTVTTYTYGVGATIVKDSAGNYHADIDANEEGTWYYRWFSTGNGQAAKEMRFVVREAQTA